jgi:hypothetical protein
MRIIAVIAAMIVGAAASAETLPPQHSAGLVYAVPADSISADLTTSVVQIRDYTADGSYKIVLECKLSKPVRAYNAFFLFPHFPKPSRKEVCPK